MPREERPKLERRSHLLHDVTMITFLVIAAFFLFTEHKAHLYGALPYVLLGVCVILAFVLWRVVKGPDSTNGNAGPGKSVDRKDQGPGGQ